MIEIFIPGNVPSSKNNKRWTGSILINSALTMSYKKAAGPVYRKYTDLVRNRLNQLQAPYKIEFTFIRDSHRKFDYINPLQTVQDLIASCHCGAKKKLRKEERKSFVCPSCQWIEDDNSKYLFPILNPYEYCKDRPGVLIRI